MFGKKKLPKDLQSEISRFLDLANVALDRLSLKQKVVDSIEADITRAEELVADPSLAQFDDITVFKHRSHILTRMIADPWGK